MSKDAYFDFTCNEKMITSPPHPSYFAPTDANGASECR